LSKFTKIQKNFNKLPDNFVKTQTQKFYPSKFPCVTPVTQCPFNFGTIL
jgi:hypothetical protein